MLVLTNPHGATSQKKVFFGDTAVKFTNLAETNKVVLNLILWKETAAVLLGKGDK
jgi:hypothetical protein